MKLILFKIFFITALLYPLFSYSADTDNREGVISTDRSPQIVQGKYHLLAIGIDNYINLPKLHTAAGDAKEITRVLMEEYGFDRGRVTMLFDTNATLKNIFKALKDVAGEIKPEDSLLIYYAGHGTLDKITKEGAWMPVDALQEDPATWISNSEIKKHLNSDSINAKHILLISDSIFAGNFLSEAGEAQKKITDALLKTSREAIISGEPKPEQYAVSNHSIFTSSILKVLKENKEDYLLPQSIHKNIKAGVSQNVIPQAQHVILQNTGGEAGGSFVFIKKKLGGAALLEKILEDKATQSTLLQERENELEKGKEEKGREVQEREEKIKLLDKNITEMQEIIKSNKKESKEKLYLMTNDKEKEEKELAVLRKKAEKEQTALEEEIKWLKEDEIKNRIAILEYDISKYNEVAEGEFAEGFTAQAWKNVLEKWHSLLDKWGVNRRDVNIGDIELFIDVLAGKDPSMEEAAVRLKERLGLSVSILIKGMILVKGGCFDMGDISGLGTASEKPIHEVCLEDFYIGRYEVTVEEFKQFIDAVGYKTEAETGAGCYIWDGHIWKEDSSKNWRSPGFIQTNRDPVVCVTWNDANKYIEWQSQRGNKNYRLPTEAEWEYAARSGGNFEIFAGTNKGITNNFAWYSSNAGRKTHPVGQKKPNGLGLYDMNGNASEWANDWYEEGYYANSTKDNPKGPANGEYKSLRGGSWMNTPYSLRSSYRFWFLPTGRYNMIGFRIAVSQK